MVSCSVMDCATSQRNNPENYSFHRFPLDSDQRNTWLSTIGRPGWTPKKGSCICSKHFEEKYIENEKKKRTLSTFAIPTKFVPVKLPPKRRETSYVYKDSVVEPTCIPSSLSQCQPVPLLLPSSDQSQPLTPHNTLSPSDLRLTPTYVYRVSVVEPTCIPSPSLQYQSVPLLLPSLDQTHPLTPQNTSSPSDLELTPRNKKLLSKYSKLHEKILKKQRTIKNLKAQKQRLKNKVITLESLLDEMQKRPGLKDHLNDIFRSMQERNVADIM